MPLVAGEPRPAPTPAATSRPPPPGRRAADRRADAGARAPASPGGGHARSGCPTPGGSCAASASRRAARTTSRWDPIRRRSPNRPWRRHGTDRLVRMVLRVALRLRERPSARAAARRRRPQPPARRRLRRPLRRDRPQHAPERARRRRLPAAPRRPRASAAAGGPGRPQALAGARRPLREGRRLGRARRPAHRAEGTRRRGQAVAQPRRPPPRPAARGLAPARRAGAVAAAPVERPLALGSDADADREAPRGKPRRSTRAVKRPRTRRTRSAPVVHAHLRALDRHAARAPQPDREVAARHAAPRGREAERGGDLGRRGPVEPLLLRRGGRRPARGLDRRGRRRRVGVGCGSASISTVTVLLFAAALPPALVAVTRHVSWWPPSPATGAYVWSSAPAIGAPSRSHWNANVGLLVHVPGWAGQRRPDHRRPGDHRRARVGGRRRIDDDQPRGRRRVVELEQAAAAEPAAAGQRGELPRARGRGQERERVAERRLERAVDRDGAAELGRSR